MQNNTKEMNDTTKAMAKTTADMKQETGEKLDQTKDQLTKTTKKLDEMSDKLESLLDGIGNTYADLRQVEALKARHESMLDELDKTDSLEAKVVAAGTFCMAFEFQLWKNNLADTEQMREQLYRDGMEEFFLKITRYLPDSDKAPDPTSSKAKMQNFMAIAATIDRVNPNAQFLAKQMNVSTVSILDLIHEALPKAAQVERGELRIEDLRPFENQVLIYQKEAIALLEARANFLPMLLIARISDISSRSLPMQAWMVYRGTDARLDNLAAVQDGLGYLKKANDEILFMQGLGIPPRIDSTLKALFNHLRVPEPGNSIAAMHLTSDQRVARTQVEASLKDQLDKFKKYINSAN
jgi:hypothetical protein